MTRVVLLTLLAGAALLAAAYYVPGVLVSGDPVYKHPELPSAMARDLRLRGCGIVRGHGVVSGNFTDSGDADWAVLCQIGDQASLLIYTAGRGRPAVLNTHPGGLDASNPEAARAIRRVGGDYVARHNPGLQLRTMQRACVEDGLGMGSVLYCYLDHKWTPLAGAD